MKTADKKDFKYSKCNAVHQPRSGLSRHKSSCLKARKFHCESCAKIISRKDSLKEHLKICRGRNDSECKLCKSVFSTSWKLKRHNGQVHSNKVRFCCQNCGGKYKWKDHFEAHQIKCDESTDLRGY